MKSKAKKNTGRVYPRITIDLPKQKILDLGLNPLPFWNDWEDHRDSFRGSGDRTLLTSEFTLTSEYFDVKRWNKKIKEQIKIRKAKQSKKKLKE